MHAQLLRQLRDALRFSTDEALSVWLAAPAVDTLPQGATLAQGLQALLQSVDASYQQFDREQELRLQSLSTTAAELAAAKKQLLETARHASQIEDRFETLRRISSDWYWEQDDQFRFTLVSSNGAALLGSDASDIIGKTRWEYVGGALDDPHWQAHHATLNAHQPFENFAFPVNTPANGLRHFSANGEPIFDAHGVFTGYRGIARDNTENVLAQRKLSASLRMTEALLEATPTPLSIKDEHQRFTHMNAPYERLLERSRAQLLGQTLRATHGDIADQGAAIERSILANPRIVQYETSRTLPSGHVVQLMVAKGPVLDTEGKVIGLVTTYNDITELKQAQERLSAQLHVTETLLESAPMAISIKDGQQRFTRINAAYEREFGVRRETLVGKKTLEANVFTPDQSGSPIEEALRASPGVRNFARTRVLPDGTTRHYSTTKAALTDATGKITGFMTMHADVTDLKNAGELAAHRLQMTNILLDASPAPTMIKNAQRRIIYINTAYEKLFNVHRDAVLNRQIRPGQEDATVSEIESVDAELLQTPSTRQFESELTGGTGRKVRCMITKSSYRDVAGAVAGIITTYSDITQLRQAERAAEEQLRLTTILLDATPMPIVVKNRDSQITLVNTAYEQMFAIKREHALAMTVTQRRPEIASDIERIERALYEQPGIHQIEREMTVGNGRKAICIVTKSTYSNQAGEVSGIITAITDISDLKRTEQNLIRAREEAEAAMRARSQFLANMSHEIRTPMNGVLGMTSILAGTTLDADQRGYLDAVKLSGEGLLKIINDILDFSKIEAGKVDIENITYDLRSRVSGLVQMFTASAREKNLALTYHIEPDVPPIVRGDPVRVTQALSNLAGNAIKFTRHGAVSLHVSVAAREQGEITLRFDVRDTGIGIPQAAIERIFDPFSQADVGTTRRFGGTGLGLTISRQLAQLMGGTLTVESTAGAGSSFSFTVKGPEAAELEEADAWLAKTQRLLFDDAPTKGVAVLLAEDNTVNQMVATAMLKKLDCIVTLARDGREAVEATQRQHFDLIMMDCHMPEMDGFAATQAIRTLEKEGQARHIIVAQTANAMEGDRESCLAAGMDDYISKPFTSEKLAAIVQRWSIKNKSV